MKSLSPEILLIASLGIAMVPLMISVGTCYLKFSIVLSLLKSGFGTQQAPSTALVMALSLVMSMVVMQPVLTDTVDRLSDVKIDELAGGSFKVLSSRGAEIVQPWKGFLLEHSGDRELAIFSDLTKKKEAAKSQSEAEATLNPQNVDRASASLVTAVAAFVLSEIKKGFTLAFFLLIPFFVIDLVVANILVALGLTMMSPVIVSLPIKILLFVTTDGWLLLARNLIKAYQ
jgi:type III secretory pathway component EscR